MHDCVCIAGMVQVRVVCSVHVVWW